MDGQRTNAPRRAVHLAAGAACVAAAWLAAPLGCAGVRDTSGNPGGGGGGRGGHGVDPDQTHTCKQELLAVVRDFRGFTVDSAQPKHPDFEYAVGSVKGIVASMIGADQKPVYAPPGPTAVTNGPDAFNQWYRDVPGVNIRFDMVSIPLVADPVRTGVFVYDNDSFFPIDNQGWGNQYQSHNFDFTTEIHFDFPYRGGEVFTFRGDDDVWVFVNGHLAIDLGGVHEAETGMVDLDQQAAALGIVAGQTYRMDIFQAERHVIYSTFHIETTLACVDNVIIP
jgi:fibro-slime domain-containing protein